MNFEVGKTYKCMDEYTILILSVEEKIRFLWIENKYMTEVLGETFEATQKQLDLYPFEEVLNG